MNEINKTLYIPLYGKALVRQKGIILDDKKAEEIWQEVEFPLKKKSKSKWLAYFMAMRARVFDDWVKMVAKNSKSSIIVHIGGGLDSRVLRVNLPNMWYDVDVADVIEERRKYYTQNEHYKMIVGDIAKPTFLDELGDKPDVIVVIEGVSMYVRNYELQNFFNKLEEKCNNISVLMDVYTPFGAKMSKYKNPIHDVGVTNVYSIEGPIIPINNTNITFLAEHSMTPQNLIDELHGMDKHIFSSFFAGKMANRLYRLYEYKLNR